MIALPKYQHIERLGHADVAGLLDGEVIVQTKLDGASLSVALDPEKGLVIASRNTTVSVGGEPATGFRGAVEYILAHEGIRRFLNEHGGILRGEWLVKHTVQYDLQFYGRFYVFDWERPTFGDAYVHPYVYISLLPNYGIDYIGTRAVLDHPTLADIQALLPGPDEYGAEQKEGLVVKRYDFVNQWGHTVWGKLVMERPPKAPRAVADLESGFVAFATDHLVLKTIHAVAELHNEPPTVRHLGEVIGRVWYDLLREELPDFVVKRRLKQFDFTAARAAVADSTRAIALAYYNGEEQHV